MCGRFHMMTDEDIQEIQVIVEEINRRYADKPVLSQVKLGEVRPTDIVPVIANSKSFEPKPFLMQWGFTGFGTDKKPIINARSETALEKSTFRKPLLERRCLIPATHYYEWEKQGSRKIKHAIKTVEPMFYMAGIYRFEEGKSLPKFIILTQQALQNISYIHDRMPVILPKELVYEWIKPSASVSTLISTLSKHIAPQSVLLMPST